MEIRHVFGTIFLLLQGTAVFGMSKSVSYFDYLNYDTISLAQQHGRSKRSLQSANQPIQLKFNSHGREFDLRLFKDSTIFHSDFVMENGKGEGIKPDLSHLYHGTLYGVEKSKVHGSIIDGIFRGVITDPSRGTYYVEETYNFHGADGGQSPIGGFNGHSVMYHEGAVIFPNQDGGKKYSDGHHHTCGAAKEDILQRMMKYQNSSISQSYENEKPDLLRRKRALDDEKTTCLLYIQTDWIFWKAFPSRELIVSKIAEHVKAVNEIYTTTPFQTNSGTYIRNINFMVKRLRINDTTDQNIPPFDDTNIGVEKFLDLISMENHNDFCLAYVFTNRDFDNGVLGLAWVGSPSGTSGGICERFKTYSDRSSKSLNTGIVTFKNYGSIMPARVTHITFAHELGHNFGSPHDSGTECTPGESRSIVLRQEGNYIMFPRATSGNDPNNDLFSSCSIRNISEVLEVRKDDCFVPSNQPICGNNIIDEGEVCDCGFSEGCEALKDNCCTPADDPNVERRCRLKPNAECSLTQGPCCDGTTCRRRATDYVCSVLTECRQQQTCNGSMTNCPTPESFTGVIRCNMDTQICKDGDCSGSICESNPAWEQCLCSPPIADPNNRTTLCHTCCQEKGNPLTCKSIEEEPYQSEFNRDVIFLQPGSACDNFNGYCDVFSICRKVDADGPLSRLKNAIFNPELYSTIRNWIVEYWWAVALMSLALVLLMAGFIKLCSVHTPSNNPRLPKHKQLPGADTLRRRRQRQVQHQQRRGRQTNSRDYEMQYR